MITVNHVVKTFDGFRALDALQIHVPDGAVYGLVGPNGAGKTTILRHLTGVMRPVEDSCRISRSFGSGFSDTSCTFTILS